MAKNQISNFFDVPSKVAMDAMNLEELKVVGRNLNGQRDKIVKIYRESTTYLQGRISEEIGREQQKRRNANPVKYDALHQGVGTNKP